MQTEMHWNKSTKTTENVRWYRATLEVIKVRKHLIESQMTNNPCKFRIRDLRRRLT